MDDTKRGLYNKFRIARTDGSSSIGEKHHGCDYFVLDLTHDPGSLPAMEAYLDWLKRQKTGSTGKYPRLEDDLRTKIAELKLRFL